MGAVVAALAVNFPPVIGHRGAAAHAPENTLAGFRAAKALGCAWVEFDVRLTADGALIVCHDDRLERTTNGHGRVSQLPLDALRTLDAGGWFGGKFAGERLPTLDEALVLCRELGLGANVEIKAERGRAAATAAAVATFLDTFADSSLAVLVSSFEADALAAAMQFAPSVPRGMLWRKPPRGWRRIAMALDCATIHLGQAGLKEATVATIRDAGYPVLAYTVNDAARARQLYEWGVASVFSDAPDIIDVAAAEDLAGAHRGANL